MWAIYLIAWLLIFAINVFPAFMPPTWMILAYFYIHYKLSLGPLVLLGATSATLGRVALAQLSGDYLSRFLSPQTKDNFKYLTKIIESHKKFTIPLMLFYGFLPIPSNQAFIFLGLAKVKMKVFVWSFFFARVISYTVWVVTAKRLTASLGYLIQSHYAKADTLLIQLVGFLILLVAVKLPYKKLFQRSK